VKAPQKRFFFYGFYCGIRGQVYTFHKFSSLVKDASTFDRRSGWASAQSVNYKAGCQADERATVRLVVVFANKYSSISFWIIKSGVYTILAISETLTFAGVSAKNIHPVH
jgi:hypothetical protein